MKDFIVGLKAAVAAPLSSLWFLSFFIRAQPWKFCWDGSKPRGYCSAHPSVSEHCCHRVWALPLALTPLPYALGSPVVATAFVSWRLLITAYVLCESHLIQFTPPLYSVHARLTGWKSWGARSLTNSTNSPSLQQVKLDYEPGDSDCTTLAFIHFPALLWRQNPWGRKKHPPVKSQ